MAKVKGRVAVLSGDGIDLGGEFGGEGVEGEKDGAQRFRGGWLGRASPTGAH